MKILIQLGHDDTTNQSTRSFMRYIKETLPGKSDV